jgi:hypothetical protein
MAAQVVSGIIHVIQYHIPGPNLLNKVGDDEVVVLVQGDGGGGVIDIGNGARIASPSTKFVTQFRLCHQVDHCSRVIAKKPLAGVGYCAA